MGNKLTRTTVLQKEEHLKSKAKCKFKDRELQPQLSGTCFGDSTENSRLRVFFITYKR